MGVQRAWRKSLFEEWRVRGNLALVLILIAMSGGEIGAIGRTGDGDFALRAATDGADLFAFGGTEAPDLSFFTNWTRQKISPV